jgi:hypothetical protein
MISDPAGDNRLTPDGRRESSYPIGVSPVPIPFSGLKGSDNSAGPGLLHGMSVSNCGLGQLLVVPRANEKPTQA